MHIEWSFLHQAVLLFAATHTIPTLPGACRLVEKDGAGCQVMSGGRYFGITRLGISFYRDGRDIRAFTPVFDGLLPGHDQVELPRVLRLLHRPLPAFAGTSFAGDDMQVMQLFLDASLVTLSARPGPTGSHKALPDYRQGRAGAVPHRESSRAEDWRSRRR